MLVVEAAAAAWVQLPACHVDVHPLASLLLAWPNLPLQLQGGTRYGRPLLHLLLVLPAGGL
jgi:hypothetical protein